MNTNTKFKAVLSESTRGLPIDAAGGIPVISASYLPHSVIRVNEDHETIIAAFHSRAYAQQFSDFMNAQVSPGTEPDNSGTDPLSEEQHNV